MTLSEQRMERAGLLAYIEQMTGAKVLVGSVGDRETRVVLNGGTSKLLELRMAAVPNETLRTAAALIESWQ